MTLDHSFGLPATTAGQLEHSRQHREGSEPHPLWERCPVAARIVEIETAAATPARRHSEGAVRFSARTSRRPRARTR